MSELFVNNFISRMMMCINPVNCPILGYSVQSCYPLLEVEYTLKKKMSNSGLLRYIQKCGIVNFYNDAYFDFYSSGVMFRTEEGYCLQPEYDMNIDLFSKKYHNFTNNDDIIFYMYEVFDLSGKWCTVAKCYDDQGDLRPLKYFNVIERHIVNRVI